MLTEDWRCRIIYEYLHAVAVPVGMITGTIIVFLLWWWFHAELRTWWRAFSARMVTILLNINDAASNYLLGVLFGKGAEVDHKNDYNPI